ncbi:MAG: hypothetical protein ACO32I_06695 [Candidatus Limnocylindrus sp.]
MQKNPLRLKGGDETRRYAKIVAQAYADAPDFDPAAVPAFQALARSLPKLFRMVQSKVEVVFVDGQPYRDDAHLVSEVRRTGKLLVPRDFNNHPVFTPEQNLQSRAVHDWFAHLAPSAEFSQRGELRAYNAQAKLTPRAALPALFTDIVGQAMFATVYGYFAPQKIAILDGFDYVEVGRGPAVERAIAEGVEGVPEADPTAEYWEEPTKNPGGKMRKKNPIEGAPVREYNVVAPDGTIVSSWDYREDAQDDLDDNEAAYPAGCRILTERGLRRFRSHLAGDLESLNRNPSGAKQRARGTREVDPRAHHTPSWQQRHERYMRSAAASRRTAAAQPQYDHHGDDPRADHIMRADEHRFAAKQIRELSRPYAFEVRAESGRTGTFQTHAEALKWAESNLKKGEFFTVSKDSDHFHEHYVKE